MHGPTLARLIHSCVHLFWYCITILTLQGQDPPFCIILATVMCSWVVIIITVASPSKLLMTNSLDTYPPESLWKTPRSNNTNYLPSICLSFSHPDTARTHTTYLPLDFGSSAPRFLFCFFGFLSGSNTSRSLFSLWEQAMAAVKSMRCIAKLWDACWKWVLWLSGK